MEIDLLMPAATHKFNLKTTHRGWRTRGRPRPCRCTRRNSAPATAGRRSTVCLCMYVGGYVGLRNQSSHSQGTSRKPQQSQNVKTHLDARLVDVVACFCVCICVSMEFVYLVPLIDQNPMHQHQHMSPYPKRRRTAGARAGRNPPWSRPPPSGWVCPRPVLIERLID
jgi:hypothetical protein